jgi:hypothetical protein
LTLCPAQGFFKPQFRTNVDVYALCFILYDWSDDYCETILKHLRASAKPETRLLIIEQALPYACTGKPTDMSYIKGAGMVSLPAYLSDMGVRGHTLPVFGFAAHVYPLQMMTVLKGRERTLAHFASC